MSPVTFSHWKNQPSLECALKFALSIHADCFAEIWLAHTSEEVTKVRLDSLRLEAKVNPSN